MFERLRALFRTARPARPSSLEWPWSILGETGNGIGGAPASLRSIPGRDDEAFDQLYYGELVDCFWHQGTIYAATPFAVREVLQGIAKTNAARQETLLHWVDLCLQAERLGPARPSHAGVWLPDNEQRRLNDAGIEPRTVASVIRDHHTALRSLHADSESPTVRSAAARLLPE